MSITEREAAGGPQRKIVIWPQPVILLTYGLVFLGIVIGCSAGIADSLSHGQLVVAVSMTLATGIFGVGLIYFAGGRLWADSEQVGRSQLFFGGSCRRVELARIEVGAPYSRLGPSYRFIGHDRRLAFTAPAALWKEARVVQLAQALGVPFVPAARPDATRGFVCPVCGYHGLEEPASTDEVGSGEYCPACGFEHTGLVDQARYSEWRAAWIAAGMPWYAAQAGVKAPNDWDPGAQLKQLTD